MNRAFSITEWVLTLSLVVAAFGTIQAMIKSSVSEKVRQTSDYLIWRQWEDNTGIKTEPIMNSSREYTTEARSRRREAQSQSSAYRKGGVAESLTTQTVSESSVQASVAEGSSELFNITRHPTNVSVSSPAILPSL